MSLKKKNAIKSISFRSVSGMLAMLLIISAVSFTLIGFVISKDITLTDGDTVKQITTTRIYVEEVLAEQGIILNNGDRISLPLNTVVKNNDSIVIKRAKKIVLTADGVTKEIYSCEPVLKAALAENNISLHEYDEIEPALETTVTEGMQVQIVRVNVYEETVESVVPKKEVLKNRADKPKSYTAVVSEGCDGFETTTYQVVTRDGVEISRQETAKIVSRQAIDRVVERGSNGASSVTVSVAPQTELQGKRVVICNATAYTDTVGCNGAFVGKTATGRKPQYGVIAVDPRVIPLGSKLYVESTDGSWVYGYAVAGDTGGAIKGNKVDLFFNTYNECIKFGRRQAKVYVLG